MGRGLVYPSHQGARPKAQAAAPGGQAENPDDYKTKLLKYIPGEVLAFFIPATAAIGSDEEGWLIAAFIVGAAGTILYLLMENRKVEQGKQAKPWSYLLALAAFTVWALATSPATANVIDLKQKNAGFILLFAAFIIPAVDSLLTKE